MVSASDIAGCAAPPPSKSAAHRALICAALAGEGKVNGVIDSDDMRATLGAVEAFGVHAIYKDNSVEFEKTVYKRGQPVIDCIDKHVYIKYLLYLFFISLYKGK
jgi:3-phosphoshikimate 1-carboxyvinyltransferase